MCFYFFILSLTFLPVVVYGSDLIVDPIQNYLTWVTGDDLDDVTKLQFSFYPPKTIKRVIADVTGDGLQEILLTVNGLTNGMEGNMWTIYTPVAGGYRIMGGLTFHPKAFYAGDFEGYGWGVVRYFHSSSESGSLVFTKIENGRSVDTKIREIFPKDNAEDMALYNRLFNNENQPRIEEIPLDTTPKPDVSDNQKTTESNTPTIPSVASSKEVPSITDTSASGRSAFSELSTDLSKTKDSLHITRKPDTTDDPVNKSTNPSLPFLLIFCFGIILILFAVVSCLLYVRSYQKRR
jgi:hypothetical protein